MNKKIWIIAILIVAINALAVIVRWSSLPELLPAHFDLEGNAGGSMSRSMLLVYPLISAAVCLVSYLVAYKKNKLQMAMLFLSSGISLVLLLSTLVSLTYGTMPVFMLAEPVILLIAVAGVIVSIVKSRRNTR